MMIIMSGHLREKKGLDSLTTNGTGGADRLPRTKSQIRIHEQKILRINTGQW